MSYNTFHPHRKSSSCRALLWSWRLVASGHSRLQLPRWPCNIFTNQSYINHLYPALSLVVGSKRFSVGLFFTCSCLSSTFCDLSPSTFTFSLLDHFWTTCLMWVVERRQALPCRERRREKRGKRERVTACMHASTCMHGGHGIQSAVWQCHTCEVHPDKHKLAPKGQTRVSYYSSKEIQTS